MTENQSIQVVSAQYIEAYRLIVRFNDGTQQEIDFAPFLTAYPHPQYNRYLEPECFKGFHIENGLLVWGEDWDLVFPTEQLHKGIISP